MKMILGGALDGSLDRVSPDLRASRISSAVLSTVSSGFTPAFLNVNRKRTTSSSSSSPNKILGLTSSDIQPTSCINNFPNKPNVKDSIGGDDPALSSKREFRE